MGFRRRSLYPTAIVPPYIMIEGLLCRAMAMTHPGMFLSQPGRAMQASWCCAHVTVSMLSAMISLDWREKRIPWTLVSGASLPD